MRRPTVALLAALALALGMGTAACFDVFHSTAGILTACELDAAACPGTGPTDFCGWTEDQARAQAARACAWLGACETPLGHNAFGDCMFDALLAYDCAANPSHPVRGAAHDYWDCLSKAQSCGAVERCVFAGSAPPCEGSGTGTACVGTVRVACVDGGVAHGESCAGRGQTCATEGSQGVCAGAASDDAGVGCLTSGCTGTRLHWCVDGGDVGLDCASNGAAACAGFPTSGAPQWVSCVPLGDAGCAADRAVTCTDGVASSCRAGAAETLDCATLLQTTAGCSGDAGAAQPWDWTAACVVDGFSCPADSCSGLSLTSCARGATFQLDCGQQGLGACTLVATGVGAEMRAACTPP